MNLVLIEGGRADCRLEYNQELESVDHQVSEITKFRELSPKQKNRFQKQKDPAASILTMIEMLGDIYCHYVD